MRRRRLLTRAEDSDPMSVVSNLFDVAMVFAVALMVALAGGFHYGQESRKGKYGDHHQGRRENQPLHALRQQ